MKCISSIIFIIIIRYHCYIIIDTLYWNNIFLKSENKKDYWFMLYWTLWSSINVTTIVAGSFCCWILFIQTLCPFEIKLTSFDKLINWINCFVFCLYVNQRTSQKGVNRFCKSSNRRSVFAVQNQKFKNEFPILQNKTTFVWHTVGYPLIVYPNVYFDSKPKPRYS